MQGNSRGLTIRRNCPRQTFISEILRHCDRENAPLTPGKEVNRLALIRTAWIDVVVRADRNIQCLFLIPIEITDEKAVTAVVVFEPTFKRTSDARAGFAERLQG